MIKHLVAFIKDKCLDISQREHLVTDQGVKPTWSAHNDVWEGLLVLEEIDILLNRCATVEDSSLHVRKILAESCIFVLDLISKFSSVAHNQDGTFAGNRFQLVQGGQDKDGSFTQTGLGLTEDVDTEEGLWNTLLLDCRKC